MFADLDNDGYRDLFVTNGIPHDITNLDHASYRQELARTTPSFAKYSRQLRQDLKQLGNVKKPNFMFRNNRDLTFRNASAKWGFARPTYSNGAAYGDLDNDGDLDLVINNLNASASLMENTLNPAATQPDQNTF